jgi:hypothetical protein
MKNLKRYWPFFNKNGSATMKKLAIGLGVFALLNLLAYFIFPFEYIYVVYILFG